MFISHYNSALGTLRITCSEQALLSLEFADEEPELHVKPNSISMEVCNWLEGYFNGDFSSLKVPLNPEGTRFQKSVWKELMAMRPGEKISYKTLAKRMGNASAIRAIASANGSNPIPIVIPCHRVIGSDGSLVGYLGGIPRKKWLLNHEEHYVHGVKPLF